MDFLRHRPACAGMAWLIACCWLAGHSACPAANGYVFAYHEGGWPNGGQPPGGVFLSYSTDGLDFIPLNSGEPVFVTPDFPADDNDNVGAGTVFPNGTRDPSITYDEGTGLFHMVWTSNLYSRSFGYASSPDLLNWSTPELVQVWDHLDPSTPVGRTWAPEWFYDDVLDQHMVVFASDVGGETIRQYYTTTSDFETFTQPELLYARDDGGTVIDGSIAKLADDHYVMATGQQGVIRMLESDSPYGPWEPFDSPLAGSGTGLLNVATEGPSLIEIDGEWRMYVDRYGASGDVFSVLASADDAALLANEWSDKSAEADLPGTADLGSQYSGPPRHGTVFEAPNGLIASDLFDFSAADLNNDGLIDGADWLVFSDYHLTDLGGLSAAVQAARGDLNGDGANDHADFLLFKQLYVLQDAILNADSPSADAFGDLLASLNVPEPATLLLAAMASFAWTVRRS